MDASFELVMPPGWDKNFGGGSWQVIREELHAASDQLANIEYTNILNRTHILTGALISDLTPEPHPDPDDDTLARVFYGTENQLSEWGRVYMLYQEGGELGLATYTNPPREMVARALTDDLGDIEDWGLAALNNATDRISAGDF